MASTRAPASALASAALLTMLSLSLACATGSSEGEETTFASFGSGNMDDVDDDTSDTATDATGDGDTTMDVDTSASDDPSESTSTSDTSGESTSTSGTSDTSDDVPPDPCGNGILEGGEACDGVDLGGQTCVDQGFDMGQLGCNDDCTFDTSACETIEEVCGDGIVNNGEQCEPGMLGNATCASTGFVFGTLGCNAQTCVFDTSGCQNVWIEDFEEGVVPLGWSGGGNANWSITTQDKHAGTYGGKSGAIGNSQSSSAQVSVTYVQAGSVAFWHKISSETNYDFGEFYVDDVLQSEWSGAGAWVQFSTNVGVGVHTFRWTYSKDGSLVSGSDAWFVDDVSFTGGYVP
jgi:hypothetical protein